MYGKQLLKLVKINFSFETLLHYFFQYICCMKLINTILALYVLVLSCIPCSDETEQILPAYSSSYIHTSNTHSGHNHHNESCDLCSPFCICACCGGFGFEPKQIILKELLLADFPSDRNYYTFYDSFSSNFYGNIWQPPKI